MTRIVHQVQFRSYQLYSQKRGNTIQGLRCYINTTDQVKIVSFKGWINKENGLSLKWWFSPITWYLKQSRKEVNTRTSLIAVHCHCNECFQPSVRRASWSLGSKSNPTDPTQVNGHWIHRSFPSYGLTTLSHFLSFNLQDKQKTPESTVVT